MSRDVGSTKKSAPGTAATGRQSAGNDVDSSQFARSAEFGLRLRLITSSHGRWRVEFALFANHVTNCMVTLMGRQISLSMMSED